MMNNNSNKIGNYIIFPEFILRTPMIPFNYFRDLEKDLTPLLNNEIFCEAIYLASPVLYDEMLKLKENKIKNQKDIGRIYYSLYRYFSRMATRCTPFGLFAGCSLGEIGKTTNIKPTNKYNRKTRLDMYYLCSLFEHILEESDIKNQIKYYTNTTIYPVGKGSYRYIETLLNNNNRKYQISEIHSSKELGKIISLAKNGITLREIVEKLKSDYLSEADILYYLYQLIDYQIIVGDLSNAIIGDDYLDRIIRLLQDINGQNELLLYLNEVKDIVEKIDTNIETSKIQYYHEVEELVKKIDVPFQKNYLFQVDMIRKTEQITLSSTVLEELKSAIIFCNRITFPSENDSLTHFKEKFIERYDDKEVPLMEVLDSDIGIGYPINNKENDPSPLLEDLFWPLPSSKKNNLRTFNLNRFQIFILRKTIECIANQKQCIYLDDSDIKDYSLNWDDLPPTIYSMFKIIRETSDDVLIKIENLGGSCGANLLSRFAHADDGIEKFVKKITAKEQELFPDMIFAELIHLPESRVGNILLRPHCRNYELLYLATSDKSSNYKISISDVLLSIRDNRIVIKSKKLNKEIIPRLTSAHNFYNNTMPIYKFLCDLQIQNGRNSLYFDWGTLGSLFPFLPRVQYKNTILSEACWNLKIEKIQNLFELKEDDELIQQADEIRKSINLPQYTLMPDGDNELYTNWKNPLSIRSLFSIIKKRREIRLKEFLFDSDNAIARNKENVYNNECIIVLYNEKENTNSTNLYPR
ncbi:MAG: lantibiotic dehydratase family protein [Porphyromonadaceae bacterium]|nr:lantibiotic dehydratase family protein [Porphyromonadaceae bacterium]